MLTFLPLFTLLISYFISSPVQLLHFRLEGVFLFPGRKQTPDRISGRDPYHDQGAFTSRQHGRPSPQQGDPSGRGHPFRSRAGSTDSLQHHGHVMGDTIHIQGGPFSGNPDFPPSP